MCIYVVYHCLVTMDFFIYIHYLDGRYLYYAKESIFSLFSLWWIVMIIILYQSKTWHGKAVEHNGL